MHHKISAEWKGGMQFDGLVSGHTITLDDVHHDGTPSKGASPKRLLLLSAAACTGMDVVAMLEKMRVPLEGLSIDAEADGVDTHPKVYTKMKIIYHFKGAGLEAHRTEIDRAVTLSQEKYCGVSAMLRKAMDFEIVIKINS